MQNQSMAILYLHQFQFLPEVENVDQANQKQLGMLLWLT